MVRLLAMLLFALAAGAQTHPNFTGTWKQDNSRSTLPAGSTIQYSNRVEQQGSNLTVTTILGANAEHKESTYSRDYTIGGEPSATKDQEGDQFTTSVDREGDSLVFKTVEKEKAATLETREVWTLSADGATLTKKIHRTGPRGDSDQAYVLVKQ
jgi:hypothetical protein